MNQFSKEEVVARGEHIYDSQIRRQVENDQRGMYVVIDIESGEYEVDCEDLAATKRLLVRRPGAVIYGLRVGYPSAYRLGGFRKADAG